MKGAGLTTAALQFRHAHEEGQCSVLAIRSACGQTDSASETNVEQSSRLDIPRRGHVLSTAAETYGRPLREAVAALSGSLARKPQCADLHETLFGIGPRWQPLPDMVRPPAEMASWAIVSMWVLAVASGALPATASLMDAEQWFFGAETDSGLTSLASDQAIRKAEALLRAQPEPRAYFQLLPYVLDPHGPGSRLSVRRNPKTRTARTRKRAEGVFYTPADVAEHMAAACLDSVDESGASDPPTVFDPACGTGVFLRAALKELRRRHAEGSAFSIASECLFGVDIDPWPLDAAAFVLLAEIWGEEQHNGPAPVTLWRRLRRNFACIDTLRVDPAEAGTDCVSDGESPQAQDPGVAGRRIPLALLFPALKRGPRMIIGNPPYADVGDRDDFAALGRAFETLAVKPQPSAEIYLAFVEQMTRLACAERCAGALVLPLSLACNVGLQFSAARKLIAETPGRWRFAFFDREPHALFGEDVKTRNAIVVWSRAPSEDQAAVATGPLRKWRGDSRGAMFRTLQFTGIDCDIRAGIPKVDGDCQATALKVLGARWTRLEQAVQDIARINLAYAPNADDRTVFVGPTAYNFLNVFLKPPRSLLSSEQTLSEHPLFAITCTSREDALAVFAGLTSHLAYWWWHAHGDGFHVSRRFIASLPFGIELLTGDTGARLAASGQELWSQIRLDPIISLNRGRTSLAYTPNGHDYIRRKADQALTDLAGLEGTFVVELQQFTAHIIAATLRGDITNQTDEKEGV